VFEQLLYNKNLTFSYRQHRVFTARYIYIQLYVQCWVWLNQIKCSMTFNQSGLLSCYVPQQNI